MNELSKIEVYQQKSQSNNKLNTQPRPVERANLGVAEVSTCVLVLDTIARSGSPEDLELFERGLEPHQKQQIWDATPTEIKKAIYQLRVEGGVV